MDQGSHMSEGSMRIRVVLFVFVGLGLSSIAPRLDAQAAATICTDGTTSAATGKGACSSHGGVDAKATAAAKKAAASAAKAAAQVTCSDGTTSKAGRGACSHHGGIKGATTAPVT